MKKLSIFLSIFLVLGLLVGCGGDSDSPEEEATNEDPTTEENETAQEEGGDKEINQSIADDEIITATLVDIKTLEDSIFGNSIEVRFEVVNNTDKTLEVQARQVSVDNKMVDESTLSMSQEVAAGKSADAVLTIMEFEGKELPAMEENLEMNLRVFSWDDMDFGEEYPVRVDF